MTSSNPEEKGSPVTCIVIDGWHKGHMVIMPRILPVLELPRPVVTTFCECSIEDEVFKAGPSRDVYVLAFRAIDGKSAIYTVKGDSEPMVSNRDWHTYKNELPWKDTPIIVGCHDERAIFENSEALS
jgi:hypothetical protein